MIRISSVAYAILFTLLTKFFTDIIRMSPIESMCSSMALVIGIYILVSWNYLVYAFYSIENSLSTNSDSPEVIPRILALVLLISQIPAMLLLSYVVSDVFLYFPELAYGSNILLIVIFNFRTNIYKTYSAINQKRSLAGLKPI